MNTPRFTIGNSGKPGGAHRRDVPVEKGAAALVAALTAQGPQTALAPPPTKPATDDLYVPAHYEPNYAYPLILWLNGQSGSGPAGGLKQAMRRISDRNYFGASEPLDGEGELADRLHRRVARLRRRYHLHTERIYVAGAGDAGRAALRVGLERPEWFGGIIALSAQLGADSVSLSRLDVLRGKPVFLGVAADDSDRLHEARRLQRLLWTAGLAVQACAAPATAEGHAALLRAVDHWLMGSLETVCT